MTRHAPDEPGLPLAFHPLSNGEYAPLPRSAVVTEAIRRTLAVADTNARRLGMYAAGVPAVELRDGGDVDGARRVQQRGGRDDDLAGAVADRTGHHRFA